MADRIHLSKAEATHVEEEFVVRALKSGWIAPLGPDVDAFEREIAGRTGVHHALALSSGTAALHLALLNVGAAPGKVVVLPSLTFAASANAVAYTGAEPVFVDSQASDGNVDPQLLLDVVDILIAERQDVAAVMTVDLFGRCADYDLLVHELKSRDIPLIEDAAEAVGASLAGRAAGSFGLAAAFSFNGNKIMTTSGGGMLLSDDDEMIERARYLSTQARHPTPWYEHTEVGYNYRLSNLLAAFGRGQLSRLDGMISRRREIRSLYRSGLAHVLEVQFLGEGHSRDDSEDNAWLTVITLDEQSGVSPNDLVKGLESANIEARHVWKPMHLQPVYRSHRSFVTGAAERIFRTGVTLPSGAALNDAEVHRVIDSVLSTLREVR